MNYTLQPLVLGIVQGLTEFLPVSSSAHLVLIPSFLHWPNPGLAFDVALHLGTLLGVVVYFWKNLVALFQSERRLLLLLALATIPGALMGLAFHHKAETAFRSPALIACTLIALGFALALADYKTKGNRSLSSMTEFTALGLGLAQGMAIIPGVSRSGITITLALALGFQRKEAARFSFLMSIPIIAGAGMLKFKEILFSPDKAALATGFLGAAVSGFLAIWVLMRYVQTHRYTPFVLYRLALGAFVLFNLHLFV